LSYDCRKGVHQPLHMQHNRAHALTRVFDSLHSLVEVVVERLPDGAHAQNLEVVQSPEAVCT
jgi:hypothetical protein